MFHHVVLFRWKAGTTPDQVTTVAEALGALAPRLSGVQSYRFGANLGLAPANAYDFGIVGVFDDQAGWDAYMSDHEHERIRSELIGPNVDERATIQFTA